MAVTPTTFKSRFPEFSSIADARIEVFIDDAKLTISEGRWGRYYELGLFYLTAHYLSLAESSADGDDKSSGAVASQSVGDTSVSYVSPAVTSDAQLYYQQTTYGLRFLMLMKFAGAGGFVVQ